METQEKTSPKKPDRRSLRSKRLIMGALRELVLEKEFKKITVSDIAERADIGRATFYAHFENLEDLERFMFSQLLTELENELEHILSTNNLPATSNQSLVPSLALFRITAKKHQVFKKFAGPTGAKLSMLTMPLIERLEKQIENDNSVESSNKIPNRIVANYLISALISLLAEWVINDMPNSPEAMDDYYQSLAEPTLKRLTGS